MQGLRKYAIFDRLHCDIAGIGGRRSTWGNTSYVIKSLRGAPPGKPGGIYVQPLLA